MFCQGLASFWSVRAQVIQVQHRVVELVIAIIILCGNSHNMHDLAANVAGLPMFDDDVDVDDEDESPS